MNIYFYYKMINNENKFEYQEFFILNNNSVIKITICKTNQEIIIKSNNYELRLNHENIEKLMQMKFDSIEQEYNFLINIFQLNSVMIKDIIVNKSMTFNFIKDGKIKEIILLYNNESQNIFQHVFNSEFNKLQNDISQIKKDLQEMLNIPQKNNKNLNLDKKNENKKEEIDFNSDNILLYKSFMIENTLATIERQITNHENIFAHYEKKITEYHDKAKQCLREENKQGAKNYLYKKKRIVDFTKAIEGMINNLEEQKLILEKSKVYNDIMTAMKCSRIMSEEALKDINLENYKLIESIFNFDDEEEESEDEDEIEEREKKCDEFAKKEMDIIKKNNLAINFANKGINSEELDELKNIINDIKDEQNEISEYIQNKNKEKENSDNDINDENDF